MVEPGDLTGSIAGDAISKALADINVDLPKGISVNLRAADLSDIQTNMQAEVSERIGQIGLPIDPNDPILKEIIQRHAAQISERLQRNVLGLKNDIWHMREVKQSFQPMEEDDPYPWRNFTSLNAGWYCGTGAIFVTLALFVRSDFPILVTKHIYETDIVRADTLEFSARYNGSYDEAKMFTPADAQDPWSNDPV